MLSVLTRFFVIVCVALIAAFIALSLWGVESAIAAGIFIISIPLIYAYINLARLRKHILADSLENMSLPSGFWEEVFFRLQRLIRNLKQRIRSIEQQHDHFFEAFQASPNGIVMLDENDQIEWCNSIAERFFGLVFKRDVMQRINFLIRRPEFIQYLQKRFFEEPLLLESSFLSSILFFANFSTAGSSSSSSAISPSSKSSSPSSVSSLYEQERCS